jgi:pyruvate kinase
MIHRTRRAKIVATLGPASSTLEVIRQLFLSGVDVFRMNFSHGDFESHANRFRMVRDVEREFQRPISILADLQGPKLRVGKFAEGHVMLTAGQAFRFDLDTKPGTVDRVNLPHPEIFAALVSGTELLLDDGKLRVRVDRCDAESADTTVVVGGRLSERKGVNVPGVVLPISALTTKDRADL